jgi:hypothetical protein
LPGAIFRDGVGALALPADLAVERDVARIAGSGIAIKLRRPSASTSRRRYAALLKYPRRIPRQSIPYATARRRRAATAQMEKPTDVLSRRISGSRQLLAKPLCGSNSRKCRSPIHASFVSACHGNHQAATLRVAAAGTVPSGLAISFNNCTTRASTPASTSAPGLRSRRRTDKRYDCNYFARRKRTAVPMAMSYR